MRPRGCRSWTRTPLPHEAAARSLPPRTLARRSAGLPIGTITTSTGASLGGRIRPRSSPWHMITPPIIRELMPHEVVCASCSTVPFALVIGDVERGCEVRPEVVRGSGLQCAPVAHHRLQADGAHCAGEALALGLVPDDHRHGRHVAGDLGVDVGSRVRSRLVASSCGRMRGVALLPQELGRAQGRASVVAPSERRCPLVDKRGRSR
jgi:hypothetical protein